MPKFEIGELYMTPGVLQWIEEDNNERLHRVHTCLTKFVEGDWGILDAEDWQANNDAIEQGTRLLGSYNVSAEERLWIITNGDRSGTTILWPSEY